MIVLGVLVVWSGCGGDSATGSLAPEPQVSGSATGQGSPQHRGTPAERSIRSIEKLDPSNASHLQLLRRYFDQGDRSVQLAALRRLADAPCVAGVELARHAATSPAADQDRRIRHAAIGALMSAPAAAAEQATLGLIRSNEPAVLVVIVDAVRVHRPPFAQSALRRILEQSSDPDLRLRASKALEEMEKVAGGR